MCVRALTPLPLGEVGVSCGVVEVPAEHGLSTRVEVIGEDQRCGGVRGHFRRSEHKSSYKPSNAVTKVFSHLRTAYPSSRPFQAYHVLLHAMHQKLFGRGWKSTSVPRSRWQTLYHYTTLTGVIAELNDYESRNY